MGERVVLFDDLDGSEGPDVERHVFHFEGVRCEIDLTAANWAKLYLAVKPFLDKARQDGIVAAPQRLPEPRKPIVCTAGMGLSIAPAAKAAPVELPAQRQAAALPMSGGFGDYTWESEDGALPTGGVTYCTRAEMNACNRWVYAHLGRRVTSREAIAAFRAQDARLIPGWGDPPAEADVPTQVGKALVRAEKGKRARDKALAR